MKDMQKSAFRIDMLLRILDVALVIAAVALLVGLGLIGAWFLFDLEPQQLGTGFNQVEIGFLTLTLAENAKIPFEQTLYPFIYIFIMGDVCLILGHLMVKSCRRLLEPVKEGRPFHSAAGKELKLLSRYTCGLGIGMNMLQLCGSIFMGKAYNLPSLLLNDKITHVSMNYTVQLDFLVVAAILLLLSYIFSYGQELQQLSDETV